MAALPSPLRHLAIDNSSTEAQFISRPQRFTSTASPSSPPAKRQKMSISQTYVLAHTARAKLSRAAAQPDHDLRLLVGHANLLDSLMLELAEAEREQEQWFNKTVSKATATEEPQSQKQEQEQARHVTWADAQTVPEETEWEVESDSSDEEEDSDDEDVDMLSSIPPRRMTPTISVTTSTTTMSANAYDSDESDAEAEEDDDEDALSGDLALVRTHSRSSPSLSLSSPSSPPELLLDDFDDEEDSASSSDEDEASTPPAAQLTFAPSATSTPQKPNAQQLSDVEQQLFLDEGYFLPTTAATQSLQQQRPSPQPIAAAC